MNMVPARLVRLAPSVPARVSAIRIQGSRPSPPISGLSDPNVGVRLFVVRPGKCQPRHQSRGVASRR